MENQKDRHEILNKLQMLFNEKKELVTDNDLYSEMMREMILNTYSEN